MTNASQNLICQQIFIETQKYFFFFLVHASTLEPTNLPIIYFFLFLIAGGLPESISRLHENNHQIIPMKPIDQPTKHNMR